MPEPVRDGAVWKCPICGFTAMNRKTVEAHIKTKHPEALKAEKERKKKKKGKKEKSERVDYIKGLEGQHVVIHFITGLTLPCIVIEAEDRFNIHVKADDGRELIIPRGHILFYELER